MLQGPRVAATINNPLGYPPQWWQDLLPVVFFGGMVEAGW